MRPDGGPWFIAGRVYNDWSRIPLKLRRSLERRARAKKRYDGLLEGSSGWRRTAVGLVLGSAVALGVAELLWRL